MNSIFKRAVSLVLVLCVLLLGTLTPNAYADELAGSGISSSRSKIEISGHHNSTTINNYPKDEYYGSQESSGFVDSVAYGAINTMGTIIGAVVVCYAVDAAATTFFPPAAALAAYCPIAGTTMGSGSKVIRGVQAFAK
jgi:hypothetical protein